MDDLNEIAVSRRCGPSRITDALSGLPRSRADVAGNVDALVHANQTNRSRSEHPFAGQIQVVVVGRGRTSASPPKLGSSGQLRHRYRQDEVPSTMRLRAEEEISDHDI